MRGILARASGVDRPVRHPPAHAMPSPGRMKRIRISGHDHGARHARVSIETRRSLAELRQRLTRLAHVPRIADRVVVFVDAHLSARHWGARPVRTRAFRVALFICVVSAGFITAAPSLSAGDGGPPRASSVAHRPPLQIASGPTASRLSASGQPPKECCTGNRRHTVGRRAASGSLRQRAGRSVARHADPNTARAGRSGPGASVERPRSASGS